MDDFTRVSHRDDRGQSVARAMQRLARVASTTQWTTPADIAAHRAELTRRITVGDRSDYDRPLLFSEIDLPKVHEVVDAARAAAAQLTDPLHALVSAEIEETQAHVEAIASRDDAMLAGWAAQQAPARELVGAAQRILDSREPPVDPPTADVPAGRVAEMLTVALANYGLHDWSVEVTPAMAAKASVRHSDRQLRVRADALFTEAGAQRIVVHEAGGHVLRWVNAEAQPEPLAARPLGRSVPTEEGLAVLLEEQLGVSSPDIVETYALRVVAVDAAQSRGLLDLAFFLADLAPPSEAAELALRIRRGFTDTQSHGGLTKDSGYLEGLLACRELALTDPHDLRLMRAVKWPLDQLPLVRELASTGRLTPPAMRPDLGRLGLV